MSSQKPPKTILGTIAIGDPTLPLSKGIATFNTPEAIQGLLTAFRTRGYTDLDTAQNYGASESFLGRASAPATFTIHTKVLSHGPGSHQTAKIRQSISDSLAALGVDSVETMFLHVPDRETPFEETLEAMNEAFKEGKFRKLGLCSYTFEETRRILDICGEKGWVKPSVYQGQYNALTRGGEAELFPLLREHNMAFFGFSPAAGGFLADHAPTAKRWKDETSVGQIYIPMYSDPAVKASAATIREAAKKHNITGHAAVLRWTAYHSCIDSTYGDGIIFGVSTIEQLHQCLDAIEAGPLPKELVGMLDAVYATFDGKGPPYHQ